MYIYINIYIFVMYILYVYIILYYIILYYTGTLRFACY